MFVEDIIHRLANSGPFLFTGSVIRVSSIDQTLINSLSDQLSRGNGFTEKQSVLALRLINKYWMQLEAALKINITKITLNPQYKLPMRVLSTVKTVKISESAQSTSSAIQVVFPYDENLVAIIKNYKKETRDNYINWNGENKSWDFPLKEEYLHWIKQTLTPLNFDFDEKIKELFVQIEHIEKNIENYVPMLVFEDNKFLFKNTHTNIPQPTSTDLIDVMIEAKKYGIFTWSEDINLALEQLDINENLKKYLLDSNVRVLPSGTEKLSFDDVKSISKYNLPCLVVLPGGSEYAHLKTCIEMFKENGVFSEEMTVLFRLDNSTKKDFNIFVKDSNLNNPLSEKIKVVFISGKIPKPLIESKINFPIIINFGISGVHYTLSNYLKNHHFVVNYTLKEQDFAQL